MAEQFIIYCDESTEKGRYYSHFYGGALIRADRRQWIEDHLTARKESLNLFKELKWVRITANYLEKYKSFLDAYFDLIEHGHIKVRIMFTQNVHAPRNLDDYQIDNQYFLLHYQLIKHAFGLSTQIQTTTCISTFPCYSMMCRRRGANSISSKTT